VLMNIANNKVTKARAHVFVNNNTNPLSIILA
jgi:hypothetical protein